MDEETGAIVTAAGPPLVAYTCERCGFVFNKTYDRPPYLCYRCLRYIAKRVWTIVGTLVPATSRPEREDI